MLCHNLLQRWPLTAALSPRHYCSFNVAISSSPSIATNILMFLQSSIFLAHGKIVINLYWWNLIILCSRLSISTWTHKSVAIGLNSVGLGLGGTMAHYCIPLCSFPIKDCVYASSGCLSKLLQSHTDWVAWSQLLDMEGEVQCIA